MKAVVASDKFGEPTVVTDRPKPKLRPTWMLVRTMAVAANPADNLYLSFGEAIKGSLLGCDYAGIVEEVGADVIRNFKKGDRVCGCIRAGDSVNIELGTAAEYIVVKADIAFHMPDGATFEEAATTGVTWLTTGRCLYRTFDIPFPDEKAAPEAQGPILIYGGSTAMGTVLMQFAKLSGFTVLTTCSPHNFELVKSYGADHVFDYHDPDSVAQIKALTNDDLGLVIDCISMPGQTDAAVYCSSAFGTKGGKYSCLAPMVSTTRDDVKDYATHGFAFLNETWSFMGQTYPGSPEEFTFSMRFAEVAEKLYQAGKVRVHPVELREGGLDAYPQAMDDLKNSRVSGKKLVVRVA